MAVGLPHRVSFKRIAVLLLLSALAGGLYLWKVSRWHVANTAETLDTSAPSALQLPMLRERTYQRFQKQIKLRWVEMGMHEKQRVVIQRGNMDTALDLGPWMKSLGAVAGINGGYYDLKMFEPCHFTVSDGKVINQTLPRHELVGLWVVKDGKAGIHRAVDWPESAEEMAKGVSQAVTCSPLLIWKGKNALKERDEALFSRSAIATDGQGRWAMITSSECSLYDLASLLESQSLFNTPIAAALNLDGGPSTNLWAKAGVEAHPPLVSVPVAIGVFRDSPPEF